MAYYKTAMQVCQYQIAFLLKNYSYSGEILALKELFLNNLQDLKKKMQKGIDKLLTMVYTATIETTKAL